MQNGNKLRVLGDLVNVCSSCGPKHSASRFVSLVEAGKVGFWLQHSQDIGLVEVRLLSCESTFTGEVAYHWRSIR